jgi:hypothetical protein
MSTTNTVLNKKLYQDCTSINIDNGHFIVPDGTMGDVGAAWTISAWILRDNASYGASPLISLRTDGAPNEIIDISPNSSNELRITIEDGTGFDQNLQVDMKDLPEVPVSTWEQLVVVYDAAEVPALPLYWNGFKLSDIVQSGNEGDPYQLNVSGGANEDPQLTNANKIIRLCGFLTTDHQMSMYNMCMWNVAFTDDEVREIYNAGNPLFDPRVNQGDYQRKDNLRLYYNFQDPHNRFKNYGSLTTRKLTEENPAANYPYTDDKPDPTTETVGGRNCTFLVNGSNHQMTSLAADATLDGFGDTFTWSQWIKFTAAGTAAEFPRPMLMLTTTAGLGNLVQVLTNENNQMSFVMRNNAGTNFKQYIGPTNLGGNLNTWKHYVFTWDGTDLLFYEQNVDITNTTVTKFIDLTDNRVEAPGYWLMGATGSQELPAKIYQPAIWNSVLTPDEISELYFDPEHDYRVNQVDYVSSANLVHYWPFANDLYRGKDEVGDHHLTVNNVLPWNTSDLPV